MKSTAKAPTNIALIKYWGKRDEELMLPANSSLSVTLDRFFTVTTVEFLEDATKDVFYFNGERASETETKKVSRFLDIVRSLAGSSLYATVHSQNHVPTAAGFASSASGYAALAAASAKAIGLPLEGSFLSRLARRGSGSACRSIYGGFVEWKKGELNNGSDSFAVQILDEKGWDFTILSVVLENKRKKVLSREGMQRTVETSPFFQGWLNTVNTDLQLAKEAIRERDFEKLGTVAEKNALKMHATTLGADPPFLYWQPGTLEVMERVQELRLSGIPAFFTIDAGPNVKVLCLNEDEEAVVKELSALSSVKEIFSCHPGPGVTFLD